MDNFLRFSALFVLFFSISFGLHAQNKRFESKISAKKVAKKLHIDGNLDEAEWKNAPLASSFYQYFPFDTSYSKSKTEVYVLYDEHFLYIGAKMHDDMGKKYSTASLRRDFRGPGFDGFTAVIDPFQDQTNGFAFGLNPYGVQREALISNGGSGDGDNFALAWDNKWYGESKINDGSWTLEMAIPFKTLRFKGGAEKWHINFYRIDSKYNERSSWIHIPRNFELFNLAYMGELVWDKPLGKPGANIALIPYLSAGTEKRHIDGTAAKNTIGVGGDAKIAVTPSLNLDLTANPDFSQVEVDRQVTNLQRFEIFFPERRQFFLENADLFSNFGSDGVSPFFSRRIGVTVDKTTGQNIQNPILFGARLSGRINKDWRTGLMTMQTAKDEANALPSLNYSVAALQRRIGKRSNISGIFVNKQALNGGTFKDNFEGRNAKYNRVAGLDYNLASPDGKWAGKAFYHQSFSDSNRNQQYARGVNLTRSTRIYNLRGSVQQVGENYNPAVGFTPRTNYTRYAAGGWYNFYPKSKIINNHSPWFETEFITTPQNGLTDRSIRGGYYWGFQNTSEAVIGVGQDYTYLFFSFDPTNTGGKELAEGTAHTYNYYFFNYNSDQRKKFNFSINLSNGGYYNGKRLSLRTSMSYRFQPYGSFTLDMTYNRIRMPEGYASADLLLISPRLDVTFTKSIFLTTFVQFNNQINNINLNARLQWRFAPVSDLFLVYTDNYFADNLRVKSRAVVMKWTYWLNI